MKKLKFLSFVFFIFFSLEISSCLVSEPVYPQHASVSFQVFYDELSPYGRWIDYPGYGFAWVPIGYPDFYPYASAGYWTYTSFGWTWVSHYSWGWAPFHYGRWFFDAMLGWIWIPGSEWGPAWVVWASAPGYYGWVPMFPSYGYHIHSYPHDYWTFVPSNDFGKKEVYYGPRKNNSALVQNANIIDNKEVEKTRNATYYTGPRVEEVQKTTGRQIKPMAVKEIEKPTQSVRGDELRIYRPQVQKMQTAERPQAPKKISKVEDVKTEKQVIQQRGTEQPGIQTVPRDKTDVEPELPGIEKAKPQEQLPQRKQRPVIEKEEQVQPVTPVEKEKTQPVPLEKPGRISRDQQKEQEQKESKPAQQQPEKQQEKQQEQPKQRTTQPRQAQPQTPQKTQPAVKQPRQQGRQTTPKQEKPRGRGNSED